MKPDNALCHFKSDGIVDKTIIRIYPYQPGFFGIKQSWGEGGGTHKFFVDIIIFQKGHWNYVFMKRFNYLSL